MVLRSGTIAVELALRGVGVGDGDEVILAAYDFPGNFRAVEAVGAFPVLVDIDPGTWCLDPRQLAEAWSPRVKALVVSHLHGGLAAMGALRQWADERGVAIVEDACQAPGAMVDGRMAGSWGDAGVLSFGGSKLLTAGRGGAVLTGRADVYQRLKVHSERGNQAFPLSELQAAVLLPQLEKLAARNEVRRRRVARLLDLTAELGELIPVQLRPDGGLPSFYKLAWRYEPQPHRAVDRQRLLAALWAAGVPMDAGFRGFGLRGPRRCRQSGPLTAARQAASSTVLLHHPILLADEGVVERLAEVMREVLAASIPS